MVNYFFAIRGKPRERLPAKRIRSINTLTTDRFGVMQGDIALFTENMAFGVGAGASKYLRSYRPGLVAHTETTRLLAEHGFLGVVYILCIIYLIIKVYRSPNDRPYKGLLAGFFTNRLVYHLSRRYQNLYHPITDRTKCNLYSPCQTFCISEISFQNTG